MNRNKLKGNLALLVAAAVWGTGMVAQKISISSMPPLAFNGIRYLLATIVLAPLLAYNINKTGYFDRKQHSHEIIQYRLKKALIGGALSGFLMGLSVDLQQIGLMTVEASKSGFITAIYIVFTPIVGIFVGQWPKLRVYICCAIAMTGFFLLSGGNGIGDVSRGEIITLIAGLVYAIQIWVINGYVDKDNDIIMSVITLAVAGIMTMAVSLIVEDTTKAQIMNSLPIILYAVFLPTAVGYTCQIVGQKYADSTSAAFIMSLESVFSALFAAIILGDRLTLLELLGCALIFGANFLLQAKPKGES